MKIQRIAKWKIYFDRAKAYIGYIQFLSILFIVVKMLRDGPVKTFLFDNWYFTFPAIFVVFIMGCLVLGYIESLFKLREYEQANFLGTNPEWEKLVKKVDEINKKL